MKPSNHEWKTIRAWRADQRKRLIETRGALSEDIRLKRSEAIARLLEVELASQNASIVGFYWPIKGEPDLRPLMQTLVENKLRIALPVVVEKNQPLEFREWMPNAIMESGIWNIPIPINGAVITPTQIIAPCVGFDAQGFRLGYGGGFYDRTLVTLHPRPCLIGVGYAESELNSIYPQSHDIAAELIITEEEVKSTGSPIE